MLAIVLACEHFRQMLYGVKFQVVTDHQPLKALLISSELSPRLSRWLSRLEMFDPEIVYREGKKHGNADGLSRMAVEECDEQEDNLSTPINEIYIIDDEDDDSTTAFDEEEDLISAFEEEGDEYVENLNINLETINVINLQAETADLEQGRDTNIAWIYNILKREAFEGKHSKITAFENTKTSSTYNQQAIIS